MSTTDLADALTAQADRELAIRRDPALRAKADTLARLQASLPRLEAIGGSWAVAEQVKHAAQLEEELRK